MGKNGHFQRFGLLAPRVTKRTSLFKFVNHPGVLVAKVGYFGVKSAKVHPEQMGTKPAKVGHLAANLLKYVPKKQNKKGAPRGFEPRSNDGI